MIYYAAVQLPDRTSHDMQPVARRWRFLPTRAWRCSACDIERDKPVNAGHCEPGHQEAFGAAAGLALQRTVSTMMKCGQTPIPWDKVEIVQDHDFDYLRDRVVVTVRP